MKDTDGHWRLFRLRLETKMRNPITEVVTDVQWARLSRKTGKLMRLTRQWLKLPRKTVPWARLSRKTA